MRRDRVGHDFGRDNRQQPCRALRGSNPLTPGPPGRGPPHGLHALHGARGSRQRWTCPCKNHLPVPAIPIQIGGCCTDTSRCSSRSCRAYVDRNQILPNCTPNVRTPARVLREKATERDNGASSGWPICRGSVGTPSAGIPRHPFHFMREAGLGKQPPS